MAGLTLWLGNARPNRLTVRNALLYALQQRAASRHATPPSGKVNHAQDPVRQRAVADPQILVGCQLSFRWSNISLRQSAAEAASHQGSYQAAAAGALGNHAGAELHLRSPEPVDPPA